MPSDVWRAILDRLGLENERIVERYDMIFHLVTAAIGAEESYTVANNSARTETLAEARRLDQLTWQAWEQHESHVKIENTSKHFEDKVNNIINHITNFISGH